MRPTSVALVAVVTAAVLSPTGAQAQSFFEKLFGLSPSSPPAAPAVQSLPSQPAPLRSPAPVVIHSAAERSRDEAAADGLRRRATGRFRAVCVRLCDGYYWPMNDRATSQTLFDTANRCKAACGTEARLFYSENDDTEPAAMTDLSGRRYDALRTAFLYREKLIAGCSCKPAPWSAAEQSRHQGYAIAAARAAEQVRVTAAAEAARKEAEKARELAAADLRAARTASPTGEQSSQPAVAGRRPEDSGTAGFAKMAEGRQTTASFGDAAGDAPESRFEPTSATAMPTPTPEIASVGAGAPRARTIRVSESAAPRPKPQRKASDVRPQRVAASGPQGGGFGLFGGGKPKYVWPGDRP